MDHRAVFVSLQPLKLKSGISYYNQQFIKALKSLDHFVGVRTLELGSYNSRVLSFWWRCVLVARLLKASLSAQTIFLGHVNALRICTFFYPWFKGKKIYVIGHGVDVWKTIPSLRGVIRRNLDVEFGFVSDFSRRKFLARNEVPRNFRTHIVPNVLSDSTITKIRDTGYEKRDDLDVLRLIFVGRLNAQEKYKGIDQLIEAVSIMKPKVREVLMIKVIGAGDDLCRLKNKAEKFGVRKQIEFLGFVSDSQKYSLLRGADYLCLCGFGEGFGIVLLEAYVAGADIIGSQLDATGEVIDGLGKGYTLDPSDIENFCLDLEILFTNRFAKPKKELHYLPERFTERGMASAIGVMLK